MPQAAEARGIPPPHYPIYDYYLYNNYNHNNHIYNNHIYSFMDSLPSVKNDGSRMTWLQPVLSSFVSSLSS